MMVTFVSSAGTSHLMDASRGVTACGRKYFTPHYHSAFNLITCRKCAAHLGRCGRCQELLAEQQRREQRT